VTREGGLEAFQRRPSRTAESALAPLEVAAEMVRELCRRAGRDDLRVGLGCPGVIEPGSGVQIGTTPHLPHWDGMPVGARLGERLGITPSVDNDANCAALAEARVGAAAGARISATLTLGTGIGCGIVVEGRVLRGAFGGAGEVGHLPLGSGATACRCGVAGCVEPEASASGLLASARAAGLEVASAEQVFERAAGGDATAARLVARMADRLGAVIAVIVATLNPEVIAIGGGVSRAGAALFDPLRAAVDRYALASHRRSLRVVPATLGERAGTVGAGLMAWEGAEAEGAARKR